VPFLTTWQKLLERDKLLGVNSTKKSMAIFAHWSSLGAAAVARSLESQLFIRNSGPRQKIEHKKRGLHVSSYTIRKQNQYINETSTTFSLVTVLTEATPRGTHCKLNSWVHGI
jgi:hypothetical protein